MSILFSGRIGYKPNVGDKLYVYKDGLKPTEEQLYTDEARTIVQAQPLMATSAGWPVAFLSSTQKVQIEVYASDDNLVYAPAEGFTIPDAVDINTAVEEVNAAIAALQDRAFTDNPLRNTGFQKAQGSQTQVVGSYHETVIKPWFANVSNVTTAITSQGSIVGFTGTTGNYLQIDVQGITGASSVALRQRIEHRRSTPFSNKTNVLSINVRHDFGSDLTYVITINKANAKDDFSGVTQIASNTSVVPTGVDTRITSDPVDYGDCSNGLEIIVSVQATAVIASSSFYYSDASFDSGGVEIAYTHSNTDTDTSGTELKSTAAEQNWAKDHYAREIGLKGAVTYDETNDIFYLCGNCYKGVYTGYIPGISPYDWTYTTLGAATLVEISSAGVRFFAAASGAANSQITWNEVAHLDTSNQVDIKAPLTVDDDGSTATGEAALESDFFQLGRSRVSDGVAQLYLSARASVGSDYDMRMYRSGGANGDGFLESRGSGSLAINSVNSTGNVSFRNANTVMAKVNSAGFAIGADGSELKVVYHGRVTSTGGATWLPSGWSVARSSLGVYVVTHGGDLTGASVAGILSTLHWSLVSGASQVTTVTATTFTVANHDLAGTLIDSDFVFFAWRK